jgi:hypothetical protein
MMSGNGQDDAKGKEPVERVVDLFVHMPIGFAVMAWKRVPEFVVAVPGMVGEALSKGCAQLSEAEGRLSEEVRKARMIGQVAVTFGGRQLRREVDARLRDARQAAGGVASFVPGAGAGGPNGAGRDPAGGVSATATSTEPASAPSTAAPVPVAPSVPEAPSAPVAASKATRAPTKPTGARKTAKASPAKTTRPSPAKATGAAPAKATGPSPAKATGPSPAKASGASPAKGAKAPAAAKTPARPVATPGVASAADLPIREYDGLSASQVVSRLTGLTPEELRAVRGYEDASRGRRTVLLAIDRLLA